MGGRGRGGRGGGERGGGEREGERRVGLSEARCQEQGPHRAYGPPLRALRYYPTLCYIYCNYTTITCTHTLFLRIRARHYDTHAAALLYHPALAPCKLASHFRVSPSVICRSAFKSSGSTQPKLLESHTDRSTPVTGPRSAKLSFETPRCSCGSRPGPAPLRQACPALEARAARHEIPAGRLHTSRKAVTLRLISSNISRTEVILTTISGFV